jgi:hypothetical protein
MNCLNASLRSEPRAQPPRDDCWAMTAPAASLSRALGGSSAARQAVQRGFAATDVAESLSRNRPRGGRYAPRNGACDRISEIFFRPARSRRNRPATLSRDDRARSARTTMARTGSIMMSRNPCAMRLSCIRCDRAHARVQRRDGCSKAHTGRRGRRQRRSLAPHHCPPFVKWSRCFLRCAVVIGMQCSSIRECTDP